MKVGMRTPNLKKRVSSRTTGAINRKVKRATSPYYGQKGIGWVKDPKRAAYNNLYNKITFGFGADEGCLFGCGCASIIVFIAMMVFIYNIISTLLSVK
ncbi:hypothetical protein [Streptococcus oralis]|uniref:hypothetical protein n=1 Tax=Streptococcus oralis TaxID=1303 RepID=UPI002001D106|nr:hypothetical protein [Streptococcus oralis]